MENGQKKGGGLTTTLCSFYKGPRRFGDCVLKQFGEKQFSWEIPEVESAFCHKSPSIRLNLNVEYFSEYEIRKSYNPYLSNLQMINTIVVAITLNYLSSFKTK